MVITKVFQSALSDNPDPITLNTVNATTFATILSFHVSHLDDWLSYDDGSAAPSVVDQCAIATISVHHPLLVAYIDNS